MKAAKRTTRNQRIGNRRTTWRRLDSSLFLLVKKDREEHAWQFPQGGWEEEDGSSLRVSRERVQEECGDRGASLLCFERSELISCVCVESVQKKHNAFGAKVFYYRALFQGAYFDEDASTPKLENGLVDYAWVAADELDDYFESDHAEYMRQVLWMRDIGKEEDDSLLLSLLLLLSNIYIYLMLSFIMIIWAIHTKVRISKDVDVPNNKQDRY